MWRDRKLHLYLVRFVSMSFRFVLCGIHDNHKYSSKKKSKREFNPIEVIQTGYDWIDHKVSLSRIVSWIRWIINSKKKANKKVCRMLFICALRIVCQMSWLSNVKVSTDGTHGEHVWRSLAKLIIIQVFPIIYILNVLLHCLFVIPHWQFKKR